MCSSSSNLDFDWEDYLTLAHCLHQDSTLEIRDEARWRCSISRAYYAVFGKAKSHLLNIDKTPVPTTDAHSFVIREFKNSKSRERRKIGTTLDRLRKDRTTADYEETSEVTSGMAQASIIQAKITMTLLKQLHK